MNNRLATWLHYQTAQLLTWLHLHDRAIAKFKDALALDPNHAASWRCLGFLHAQRGDDAAAIDAFTAALRTDPRDDVTRFNLAFILHRLKRHAEAIAEFEQVVATSPKNDRAWFGLGLCRKELGDLENAAEALREAGRLQYFNPHAGYELALVYHKLGRHEELLAEYLRVKSFEPKFAEQIRVETGISAAESA